MKTEHKTEDVFVTKINVRAKKNKNRGKIEHFSEVFEKSKSSAALAASLFHFKELTVGEVKEHLKAHNIPVRTF